MIWVHYNSWRNHAGRFLCAWAATSVSCGSADQPAARAGECFSRRQDAGASLASLAPSLREEGNVKAEETQIAFKAGAYLASLAPSLHEEGNVEAE